MEYLLYLRSRALDEEDDFADFDNFRAFSSAVHRCLIAVDFVKQLPNADPDSRQSSSSGVHDDYSFHDQVKRGRGYVYKIMRKGHFKGEGGVDLVPNFSLGRGRHGRKEESEIWGGSTRKCLIF